MTERVDFYVLKSSEAKQRWTFTCRLTEKAYLRNLRVVILNDSVSEAQALDDLLWTFNERSFIPHQLCLNDDIDPTAPVHLTLDGITMPAADLLVNLSDRMPARWDEFARVAEVIDSHPDRRRQGRERFKSYRDLKVPLETHQLDERADI